MISKKVRKILDHAHEEEDIETSGVTGFNQRQVIKRINHYINSRFLDYSGDAIFWNIINSRIAHFAKNLDLDTKDLYPYGDGSDVSYVQTTIAEAKLREWFADSQLHVELNELAEGLGTYGSHVLKITGEGKDICVKSVNLSNLYFNQFAELIKDESVVEKHYLTYDELQSKADVWDVSGIEEEEGLYEVCEFWGMYEGEYTHAYVHLDSEEDNQVLYQEEAKQEDFPYVDFHIGIYKGTWLRRGVAQNLFDIQERANTLVNQNAQATEIASLLLLRSEDGHSHGNVLENAMNGDIIHSRDLQQIGISNIGLNSFLSEMQMIERQADLVALTPQVVTGDLPPSGTPFRSVATITNAANAVFRFYRQTIGERLGNEVIKNKVLPELLKTWNKEDFVDVFHSEAAQQMFDKALEAKYKRMLMLNSLENNIVPTQETMLLAEQMLEDTAKNKRRIITYGKKFFTFPLKMYMNVTGEAVDKAQQNDAYFNALQMVQANPAIVNTPLFKQYVENNGIEYWKLTPEQQEQLEAGQATPGGPIGGRQDKLLAQVNTQV